MERHIFKFGNSSYAVVLPKKWVEKMDLKSSNSVQLREVHKGDILISTQAQRGREVGITVRASMPPKLVGRWVWLYYIYGASKLKLRSPDGIRKEQLDAIEQEMKVEAPGFEIVSQSEKEIVIEDLTNMREVSLEKIMSRMRSLINEEFRIVQRGEYESMQRSEELVNRFYALGIRYINTSQDEDAVKSFRLLQLLESIADGLYRMASFKRQAKILGKLQASFELAFSALGGDMKAIEGVFVARQEAYAEMNRGRVERLQARTIKDLATYIAQISELGLKIEESEAFLGI